MDGALTGLMTDGLTPATMLSLGLAILTAWLIYEIRQVIAHWSVYRRLTRSKMVRVGDTVRIDGNNGLTDWRIDAIEWPGTWLHLTDDPSVRRFTPHRSFFDQANTFVRHGSADRGEGRSR